MTSFVYDAAVLVAADRNERRAWAEHKARLQLGAFRWFLRRSSRRSAGPRDKPNSGAF